MSQLMVTCKNAVNDHIVSHVQHFWNIANVFNKIARWPTVYGKKKYFESIKKAVFGTISVTIASVQENIQCNLFESRLQTVLCMIGNNIENYCE